MKFDITRALNGAPIWLQDGTQVERFFVDTDSVPAKIKVKVLGQVGLEVYNLDGTSESPKFYLTIQEPRRNVYIVLYRANEARYFYTLEAATAAAARSDCVGPYTVEVQLPWAAPNILNPK